MTKIQERGCLIEFLVIFFCIFIIILILTSIIVGSLDLILTTFIITSIVTFAVFLFVNRRKRKIDEERKASSVESYIFDLGDCIFTILNYLTLFNLFQHLFGKTTCISDILPEEAKIIEEELDLIRKYKCLKKSLIPKELENAFEKRNLQLHEEAKVWSMGDDEWRIQAEKSPYIIKKESGKLKIYRANYSFVDSWVLGNLLFTIFIFWFWFSFQDIDLLKWFFNCGSP